MSIGRTIHPVYAAMGTTIFERMSGLARETGAINLGQGFPDGPPPPELIEAAYRGLSDRSQQYPPSAGVLELRDAVCDYYARRQSLALNPAQVIVTSGATEAIAAAVLAVVKPGDEVILFQPAYDAYAPMVRRAGGVPVSVMLQPPLFRYDQKVLEAAVTPRCRALILNDPLNPAGTIASKQELAMIARVCVAHDLVAICDEVWEDVRFDQASHRSLMTFEGMAQRTVKIGSAGKILGLTGWKIGWMIASGELATALARVHQFITFTSAVPLQWAVAEGLAMADLINRQRAEWGRSRSRLIEGLERAGFRVLGNDATWFVCIDLAASGIALDDNTFSERAVMEAGVATIPVSALYDGDKAPQHIVRLCFTKPDAVIDDAVSRLSAWRATL